MVSGAAWTGQAATHGGDLKDVTAPLLAHDRKRSASHINDAIEICVHQRLESLRTQLLERSDVAISSVIYDDTEVSESVNCHLHRFLGRLFVGHVEGSRPNLIAVLIHQIFEAARVAGGCDEAMTSCQHSFRDVAAQSASAASYQPDVRRCVHTVFPFSVVICCQLPCSCCDIFRSRLNAPKRQSTNSWASV